MCAIAILYFDYIITLGDEILLFWSRSWTVSIRIFFVVRYFSLFGNAFLAFYHLGNLPLTVSYSVDIILWNCSNGEEVCTAFLSVTLNLLHTTMSEQLQDIPYLWTSGFVWYTNSCCLYVHSHSLWMIGLNGAYAFKAFFVCVYMPFTAELEGY